ncbi:MAG: hypothetical protein DRP86_05720 [Candidatus Neomarinimicrobiota bacterium]|nr:hypothetical protein [Candidatus Neomarinimicrobiota bacterium]RKY49163.1 MAG: hypothetical protein DRP86_05720 [Candidatus Neomarinimicrobiota bacterium]
MARPSGFGAKIANRQKEGKKCPVCGEAISHLKVFKSVNSGKEGVKFNQKMVSVCACNKNEIFN